MSTSRAIWRRASQSSSATGRIPPPAASATTAVSRRGNGERKADDHRTAMADAGKLYDRDFLRWTEQQAMVLRRAAQELNLPLDWENLAEEIESSGKSQRAALRSQLRRILRQQFKLEAAPAIDKRRGWKGSIRDAWVEIED